MQIITEQRNVQRGNIQNEHAFTIKASAKAFGVLTNNLYSDKALAIVRELACNAYDSHVAAGCASRPIEVILPTRLNPQLVIKDFGTGLDHDQILNIYTRFFESTKTESNDFVGQLGLGSKSPFAMFKSFTVEARKDGIRRTYTAFLNEEGIPSIAQMGEVAEDCENGVTVSMHVKPEDHDKFANAAKRALMYFSPKPIVSGTQNFATFAVKHGIGGTNWKVRESEYWARMSGPFVVQGFVVYPVDGSLIKEAGLSAGATAIADMNIDFWMPIGSVDVAPSREALSYDKRTVANIVAQFEAAAKEMRDVIEADFASAKTMYEAGCKLHKYEHTGDYAMRNLFNRLHADKAFTWNGKTITYKHVLDVLKIKSTVITRASSTGRKLQYSSRYEPTTVDVKREIKLDDSVAVIIDDLHRSTSDLLKQFLDNSTNKSTVVVLKAVKKAEHDDKEIKRILKMLGDAPAKKLSELPYKPTVAARKFGGRSKAERLRFTGFKNSGRYNELNRKFSRLTWETVEVDLSKGGFYVPIERFSVIRDGKEETQFDIILNVATTLGLITDADKAKTFGFNAKEIAALNGAKNWVNLFDHLTAQFAKANIVQRTIDANAVAMLNNKMSDFNKHIGASWKHYEQQIIDGKFKAFVNKARALTAQNKVANVDHVNSFISLFNIGGDVQGKSAMAGNALVAEWNQLLEQHGLLQMVDWYYVDSSRARLIVEYINLVNAK